MDRLEMRILQYWKSYQNDPRTPAREPDMVQVKEINNGTIVYYKYFYEQHDKAQTNPIHYGIGAVAIKDLELREQSLIDSRRRERAYLGSGCL